MKTSYFGNLKNIEVPLSISLYPPKWYTGPQLKMLAPTPEMLKAIHDGGTEYEYMMQYYRRVLDHLDAQELYDAIVGEYGNDVTLLCFEKPGDFCHRRLVAKWFEDNLKIEVPEWAKPIPKTTLVF